MDIFQNVITHMYIVSFYELRKLVYMSKLIPNNIDLVLVYLLVNYIILLLSVIVKTIKKKLVCIVITVVNKINLLFVQNYMDSWLEICWRCSRLDT